MAKRTRSESQQIEQLPPVATRGTSTGDILEFDPDAAPENAEMEVQSAEEDAGTLLPDSGLLDARDAVEAMLGGFGAMAAALSAGVNSEKLGVDNIVGVGVGMKSSAGTYTGEMAVKVFVREKAPANRIESGRAVPSQVEGYPTDVEEVGEIFAQTYNRRFPRPVPCGVSSGHIQITAGTIGCLVVLNNNRLCILSNNHVLANENDSQVGDIIIQPGRVDGGHTPADRVGILERFVPIQFPGPNLVDAAAAWTSFSLVKPQHVTYNMNPNPLAPSLSLSVMKNGRTTQATQGVIIGLAVNGVRVQYDGGVAVFNNQIIIRGIGPAPFSQGGDSGSVIVSTGSRQPVGLLFAGSVTHTIANPIGAVRTALGISRFLGG